MSPHDRDAGENIPPILHGRYAIQRKLGAGGMGAVYLANDQELGRAVAIKCVMPKGAATQAQVERLMRRLHNEAQIASQLTHPAIVRVYDVFREAGTAYIVMEYVDGLTLRRRLEAGPRLSIAQVLRLSCRVAEGMREIHRREIIHRDLKSGNILIRANGEVKICDFGIAKMPGSASLTNDGRIVGTCHAMSPEQIHRVNVTTRTDLFSFGVLVYEALTGSWPFQGENEGEIMSAILHHEPRDIRTLRDDVPDALCNLISQLLQKQSELRPSNGFIDVVDALKDIMRAQFGNQDMDYAPLIAPVSTSADTLSVDDDADNLAADAPEYAERPNGDTLLTDTDAESAGAASPSPQPRQRRRWWAAAAIVAMIAGLFAARELLDRRSTASIRTSTWFADIATRTAQFRIQAGDVERIEQLKAEYWQKRLHSEQLKELHDKLADIRRRSPGLPEAYRFSAEIWQQDYKRTADNASYENARAILAEGRLIYPHSIEILSGVIALELNRGNIDEAKQVLEQLQEQHGGHIQALYMEALIRDKIGDDDQAYQLLKQALASDIANDDPVTWRIQYRLAKLEFEKGHLTAAKQQLEKLRQIAPRNYSIESLEESIKIRSDHKSTLCTNNSLASQHSSQLMECVVTLMNRKDYERALRFAIRAQAQKPNDRSISLNVGELLLLTKDRRAATDTFREIANDIKTDKLGEHELSIRTLALAHLSRLARFPLPENEASSKDEWARPAQASIEELLSRGSNTTPGTQYVAATTYALLNEQSIAAHWAEKILSDEKQEERGPRDFHYPWFDEVRNHPSLSAWF